MITVIDSGISNLGSVGSALRRVGAEYQITADPKHVAGATSLILPGVGAFADGMDGLAKRGLIEPIRAAADSGIPLLGICLGMQLLADYSDEFGRHEGLGIVPGGVVRLPALPGVRVPNIGWCDVRQTQQGNLFRGIDDEGAFYFVHSFHVVCDDVDNEIGTIGIGENRFTAVLQRGNVYGAQFHPEKSQDFGLMFLSNFLDQVVH